MASSAPASPLRRPIIRQEGRIDDTPGSTNGRVAPQAGISYGLNADLTSEYVAGGGVQWLTNYARTLSWAIDDITTDFGADVYERMLLEPQVASVFTALKAAVLEDSVSLSPAVTNRTDPGYQQAADMVDFCNAALEGMETAFSDVLWQLLDAMAFGNKLAEQVYHYDSTYTGKQQLVLSALKVKPRASTAFVVNVFNKVIGILGLVPGVGQPVQVGTMLTNPGDQPNLLPRSKFAILTFRPKDSDPRGTALDPETPIPTPDGWRKMDDLQVGSKVFDEQGRIRYVTARKDWEDRPCYRLTFRDGCEIVADENHQWPTQTVYERKTDQSYTVRTTKEIAQRLFTGNKKTRYGIIQAKPLDYPEQALPLHPYYLGLWLGDGDSITSSIACHIHDQEEQIGYLKSCGYEAYAVGTGPSHESDLGGHIRVTAGSKWAATAPQRVLRALGLLGNKHIPVAYLRGSIQQRTDLLAGLMDSDGCIDQDGRCEFVNTNEGLVEGVAELVRSLGSTAHVHVRRNGGFRPDGLWHNKAWATKFTPSVTPFRLKRKAARVINDRPYTRHYITSVESVPNRRTVCIETDGPSHLYLAGKSMIPTHNSILRPAFTPWWEKQQIRPQFLKYLTQFAGPSLVGVGPENGQAMPQVDANGNLVLDANGNPVMIQPLTALGLALANFQNGSWMTVPFGSEVNPIEMAGEGEAFIAALDRCDREIAKAILSQTLATEEGQHQARAAASVHQDILATIIRQSKFSVALMVKKDILGPLVAYNFGPAAVRYTPSVSLGRIEEEDLAAQIQAIAQLSASYPLAASQLPQIDAMLKLPPRTTNDVIVTGAAAGGQAQSGSPPKGA